MLKFFVKFFNSLNNNSHPGEIAHAVSIACILGFMPKDNAFWYVLFVFFLFIRINKGAFMLFTALFTLLSPVIDNIVEPLGYYILTLPSLQGFYATLINIPFVAFTKFNNTIVMGSLLASLVCYIPVYFITRLIIYLWRNKLVPLLRKTKVVAFFKQMPIIQKVTKVAALVSKE